MDKAIIVYVLSGREPIGIIKHRERQATDAQKSTM